MEFLNDVDCLKTLFQCKSSVVKFFGETSDESKDGKPFRVKILISYDSQDRYVIFYMKHPAIFPTISV